MTELAGHGPGNISTQTEVAVALEVNGNSAELMVKPLATEFVSTAGPARRGDRCAGAKEFGRGRRVALTRHGGLVQDRD